LGESEEGGNLKKRRHSRKRVELINENEKFHDQKEKFLRIKRIKRKISVPEMEGNIIRKS